MKGGENIEEIKEFLADKEQRQSWRMVARTMMQSCRISSSPFTNCLNEPPKAPRQITILGR